MSSSTQLSNGITNRSVKGDTYVNKGPVALRSIDHRNWLLHVLFIKRDFVSCRNIIKEELSKSKDTNEYAYYIEGLVLREERKITESLVSFEKCRKLNTKNVDNIKQIGKSLFELGRHRLALEAYLEAESLSAHPDWEIYHQIAECLLRGAGGSRDDRNEARDYLLRAVQCGRQERSYRLLADTLAQDGDIATAVSVYEAGLEVFPDVASIHTELGLLQMSLGLYHSAFGRLGTALAMEPNSPKALLAVGSIMQNHQDYDVALSKYKMAAQCGPESPELWSNIGMCFFGKQKFVAAISCLKRSLWLSPLSPKTLYNLGLVHLTTKQPASAFHFLSAAANLCPNHALTYMLLGISLKQLDDLENARLAFERATSLNHTDPAIPLNFSIYLISQQDLDIAREHLRSFDELSAGRDIHRELLETSLKLREILGDKCEVSREQLGIRNEAEVTAENIENEIENPEDVDKEEI